MCLSYVRVCLSISVDNCHILHDIREFDFVILFLGERDDIKPRTVGSLPIVVLWEHGVYVFFKFRESFACFQGKIARNKKRQGVVHFDEGLRNVTLQTQNIVRVKSTNGWSRPVVVKQIHHNGVELWKSPRVDSATHPSAMRPLLFWTSRFHPQ